MKIENLVKAKAIANVVDRATAEGHWKSACVKDAFARLDPSERSDSHRQLVRDYVDDQYAAAGLDAHGKPAPTPLDDDDNPTRPTSTPGVFVGGAGIEYWGGKQPKDMNVEEYESYRDLGFEGVDFAQSGKQILNYKNHPQGHFGGELEAIKNHYGKPATTPPLPLPKDLPVSQSKADLFLACIEAFPPDVNEAIAALETLELPVNQDWVAETSTWTFDDGSKIAINGTNIGALNPPFPGTACVGRIVYDESRLRTGIIVETYHIADASVFDVIWSNGERFNGLAANQIGLELQWGFLWVDDRQSSITEALHSAEIYGSHSDS